VSVCTYDARGRLTQTTDAAAGTCYTYEPGGLTYSTYCGGAGGAP
jgi:YD repeat-containing protein